MRKISSWLLLVVAFGIIWGGAFVFFPGSCTTPVACLNLCVLSALAVAFWLKYALLYPERENAGETLAGAAVYRATVGIYFVAAPAILLLGWIFSWSFRVQLYLQLVAGSFFFFSALCGFFVVSHTLRDTAHDRSARAAVESLQSLCARLVVRVRALPAEYSEVGIELAELADTVNYFSGIDTAEVRVADAALLDGVAAMEKRISADAAPEEIVKEIRRLRQLAEERKLLKSL